MDDYLTCFQIGGDFQQMVRKRNFIMKITKNYENHVCIKFGFKALFCCKHFYFIKGRF